MGQWQLGFMINIGQATQIAAELLSILKGLKIAWEEGCRFVELESDSQVSINLSNELNSATIDHQYFNLNFENKRVRGPTFGMFCSTQMA